MNNKALYWIALGVFALGLNSEYQQGNLSLIHRVADHTGAVICKIATRAKQTLAVARVLTGRQVGSADDQFIALQQADVDRALAEHQAEMARAMALRQGDMDRIQRRLDRVHMVVDRAQLSKMRILERTRFKLSNATRRIVVCPETGTRVMVDADPDIADLSIDVDNDQ
ncbi:MAG: hypothetical protein DMG80_03720 [Acidobacteria bacterium]|jgi:hypothetical protein|nr:MAG: hypothetical protein DMG80_03720 [Acidobacteriota bacterium]